METTEFKPRRRRSRLSFCLFGCLGFFLVFVLFFAFTGFWLYKDVPYTKPHSIYLPDSDGYLKLNLQEEDQELVAFLVALIEKQRRDTGVYEEYPIIQMFQSDPRKDIQSILPLEVEASMNAPQNSFVGTIAFTARANLAAFAFGTLRWSLRDEGLTEKIGDKEFLVLPDRRNGDFEAIYIGVHQGVYYFGNQAQPTYNAMVPEEGQPPALKAQPAMAGLDTDGLIHGYFKRSGLKFFLLNDYVQSNREPEPGSKDGKMYSDLQTMRELGIQVKLIGENQMEATLRILPEPGREADLKVVLEERLTALQERQEGLSFQIAEEPGSFLVTITQADFHLNLQ